MIGFIVINIFKFFSLFKFKIEVEIYVRIVDLRLNFDLRKVGVGELGYLFEEYNKIV